MEILIWIMGGVVAFILVIQWHTIQQLRGGITYAKDQIIKQDLEKSRIELERNCYLSSLDDLKQCCAKLGINADVLLNLRDGDMYWREQAMATIRCVMAEQLEILDDKTASAIYLVVRRILAVDTK